MTNQFQQPPKTQGPLSNHPDHKLNSQLPSDKTPQRKKRTSRKVPKHMGRKRPECQRAKAHSTPPNPGLSNNAVNNKEQRQKKTPTDKSTSQSKATDFSLSHKKQKNLDVIEAMKLKNLISLTAPPANGLLTLRITRFENLSSRRSPENALHRHDNGIATKDRTRKGTRTMRAIEICWNLLSHSNQRQLENQQKTSSKTKTGGKTVVSRA